MADMEQQYTQSAMHLPLPPPHLRQQESNTANLPEFFAKWINQNPNSEPDFNVTILMKLIAQNAYIVATTFKTPENIINWYKEKVNYYEREAYNARSNNSQNMADIQNLEIENPNFILFIAAKLAIKYLEYLQLPKTETSNAN